MRKVKFDKNELIDLDINFVIACYRNNADICIRNCALFNIKKDGKIISLDNSNEVITQGIKLACCKNYVIGQITEE